MLSVHVDSSVLRLRLVKGICDVGQNRCPSMRFCSNAAVERWHDLKLPRRAYLDFMRETLQIDKPI